MDNDVDEFIAQAKADRNARRATLDPMSRNIECIEQAIEYHIECGKSTFYPERIPLHSAAVRDLSEGLAALIRAKDSVNAEPKMAVNRVEFPNECEACGASAAEVTLSRRAGGQWLCADCNRRTVP